MPEAKETRKQMITTKEQYEAFYVSNDVEPTMTYKEYLHYNLRKLQGSTEPSSEALIEAIEDMLESLEKKDVQR
ncbi:hypothetical protein N9N32_00185 [Alphaproteobacteria bacterium]|nr:hypothetical protein [Alphaproteobacteria bacterium]